MEENKPNLNAQQENQPNPDIQQENIPVEKEIVTNQAPNTAYNPNNNLNPNQGYNPNGNNNLGSGYNPNQGYNRNQGYNQQQGYNHQQGYNQNPMYNQNPAYNPNYVGNQPYAYGPKQSGLGVASFIMSLIVLFGYFSLVSKFISLVNNPFRALGVTQGDVATIGFEMLFLVIANVVALIFGIVGTAMKNRKKGFAIAGLVISAVMLAIIIIIILIGVANS